MTASEQPYSMTVHSRANVAYRPRATDNKRSSTISARALNARPEKVPAVRCTSGEYAADGVLAKCVHSELHSVSGWIHEASIPRDMRPNRRGKTYGGFKR